MSVLDRTRPGLQTSSPAFGIDGSERVGFHRLAPALTSAAALAGLVEVLLDRITAPAMAGALGQSGAGVTSVVTWVGTFAVSVTAVLVLLAVSAWSVLVWDRHRVFALAATIAVAASLVAGVSSGRGAVVVVHFAVALAVVAFVLVIPLGESLPYLGALWAVALAVLAGQWSFSGATLASRAVGEAALVLAVLFLALTVARSSRGGLAPWFGIAVGVGLAGVSLAADYTPFVALWATGAMLWLPSLVYVGAGAAAGYVLACSVSDRSIRRLSAALVLLLVAGVEPTLVHHNVTALLALITLGTYSTREGVGSWL